MNVSRSPQFIKISRIMFKESFSNPILNDEKDQKLAAGKVVDILIYELIKQEKIDPKYEKLLSKSIHGYNKSLLIEYLEKITAINEEELISLYDEYINKSIDFIDKQVQLLMKVTQNNI